MKPDPESSRWRVLSDLERELIEADRSVRPPKALVEEVWGNICATGPYGGSGGSSTGSPNGAPGHGHPTVTTMGRVGESARQFIQMFSAGQLVTLGLSAVGIIVGAAVNVSLWVDSSHIGRSTDSIAPRHAVLTAAEMAERAEQIARDAPLRSYSPGSARVTLGDALPDRHRPMAVPTTSADSGSIRARATRPSVLTFVGSPTPPTPTNGTAPNPEQHGAEETGYAAIRADRISPLDGNPLRRDTTGESSPTTSFAMGGAITSASSSLGEGRLVGLGRDELRAGRASRALELLGKAQQAYPTGVLAEERDRLIIEALVLSGDRLGAAERERDFEIAYPRSIHLALVRSMVVQGTATP